MKKIKYRTGGSNTYYMDFLIRKSWYEARSCRSITYIYEKYALHNILKRDIALKEDKAKIIINASAYYFHKKIKL